MDYTCAERSVFGWPRESVWKLFKTMTISIQYPEGFRRKFDSSLH